MEKLNDYWGNGVRIGKKKEKKNVRSDPNAYLPIILFYHGELDGFKRFPKWIDFKFLNVPCDILSIVLTSSGHSSMVNVLNENFYYYWY